MSSLFHNRLIVAGSPYTLRQTPVTPVYAKAQKQGKRVINGLLGDPVAHGLHPPVEYRREVAEAALKGESWGYSPSLGLPKLKEIIGKLFFDNKPGIEIFIGAGVSAINDVLDRWALGDSNEKSVAIPRFSYILYFFDAAINNARVNTIEIDDKAQIDLNKFESAISSDTKLVKITTTGNPIGTTTSRESVIEILRIINKKEQEFGHPIIPVFDIMYEGFKGEDELDIFAIARNVREGPVFVVDSLSKRRVGAPGARLGWLAVSWDENVFPEDRKAFFTQFQALLLPRLGQVATPIQLGLHNYLNNVYEDTHERDSYNWFDRRRKAEVRRRVHGVLDGLAQINGVIFPDFYYDTPADQTSGVNAKRVANSFYINFGFARDQSQGEQRIIDPSARKFAQYLYDTGLPVVGTTPLDSFLPPQDRGNGGDFMRVVALQDDQLRADFLNCVSAYAEHLARK